MKLANIVIGVLVVLLLVLLAGILVVLIGNGPGTAGTEPGSMLKVIETGTAGDSAYSVFNYRGTGKITIVSYYDAALGTSQAAQTTQSTQSAQPAHKTTIQPGALSPSDALNIFIINDSLAIDAARLPELVARVKVLEQYGYAVSVTNSTTISPQGIYIVPTGAIPSYVLFSLQQDSNDGQVRQPGQIIYIGQKDLLLGSSLSGLKKEDWYSALPPAQQKRILQYDGTLADFLDTKGASESLVNSILYKGSVQVQNFTILLSGSGLKTVTIPLNVTSISSSHSSFSSSPSPSPPTFSSQVLTPNRIRIIYEFGGAGDVAGTVNGDLAAGASPGPGGNAGVNTGVNTGADNGVTGAVRGIYDSQLLYPSGQRLAPDPGSIFPWQKSTLEFLLNRTNGTAFFSISKDGKMLSHEELRRVTEENVFVEKLQFQEPGDYIITVTDNSGASSGPKPIASGILHVKDLRITLVQKTGMAYLFSVTLDGLPLKDAEAVISLGNSTMKKKFYVSDGQVVVNAQLAKGTNTFNFEMFDAVIHLDVENDADPLPEFYLKYGLPGLGLVILVYLGARLTKKPVYGLRFGDSMTQPRDEVRISRSSAIDTFKRVREGLQLGTSPITPHEFSVGLKRHVTKGMDVTEGNVESLLKSLVRLGSLESHLEYYQLGGEGNVKKNVLRRMVREKLIENGISFTESGQKFITADYEIGFFGDRFTKKALIIVDDSREPAALIATLSPAEQAAMRIKQANGMVVFVPISRLGGVL